MHAAAKRADYTGFRLAPEYLGKPRRIGAQTAHHLVSQHQYRNRGTVGRLPIRVGIDVPPFDLRGMPRPTAKQYGRQLLAEVAAVAVVEHQRVGHRVSGRAAAP